MIHPAETELVGVWQRESLAISGGEAFEDSIVYWLHAGDHFADMRWFLNPSQNEDLSVSAFAGTVQWTNPKIQFLHEIDFTEEYLEDTATLFYADGKLIERGQLTIDDQKIDFEEVWTPCGDRTIPNRFTVARLDVKAAGGNEAQFGYFVRVDNFAIAMQRVGSDFNAACWHQKDEVAEWSILQSIGRGEELLPPLSELLTGSPRSEWDVLK